MRGRVHAIRLSCGFEGLLDCINHTVSASAEGKQDVMAGSNENSWYTIAKRIDGNQVEVRQCTEPEKQLSDLYKKLDLTSPPLKRRRKICVVHFSELKKNDT